MTKPSKWWFLLWLLPFIILGGFCSLMFFDHTEKISKSILYETNGNANEAAISAALNARFPVGSSAAQVKSFFTALGGECSTTDKAISCTITTAAAPCIGIKLYLEALLTAEGTVQDIFVKTEDVSC